MFEIQRGVIRLGKRNAASRFLYAKDDQDSLATWKYDLIRVLHVFNVRSVGPPRHPLTASPQTELAMDTHFMVVDIHRNVMTGRDDGQVRSRSVGVLFALNRGQDDDISQAQTKLAISETTESTVSRSHSVAFGELPPFPKACFGRDELVEKIVGLAESLEPIALIGAAGIGKTSIALAVLHHNRIMERFGDNRRFIRCDEFPVSRAHFLTRLSKATGADVENPEDLSALRPFLSSRDMILFLDNAESILDPQGAHAREIYTVVEQLSRFNNICLAITSRITTVPPRCKRLTIPTLSVESACDIFYGIYNNGRSNIVRDLVRRLDSHALSITLLATTASHNMWDYDRLAREWDTHRTRVLRTDYNESLAATIELTLASPTFRKLGASPTLHKLMTSTTVRKLLPSPMYRTFGFDARELLEIIAFFPQGVDENNLDWLFPTVSDRKNIFDKFCVLSLAHRTGSFITMLAPIRDYFSPPDPKSSPLLCAVKDRYFRRLSVPVEPDSPEFKKGQWIASEDLNAERLLEVFTTIDADSDGVWDACDHFMNHLYWHKPRQTVLRAKIEGLRDDHPSKPGYLLRLSRLFASVGNPAEQKRLLLHTLKLERTRRDDHRIARTLMDLSDANRMLGLLEEGIRQVKEALGIYERSGHTTGQTKCLNDLARLLFDDKQLDAAKDAASRALMLLPPEGQEFQVCQSHRVLGNIYRSKGRRGKAVHHYEVALGIASPFNWHQQLFWIHHSLALLHFDEDRFDGAHVHVKRAKSHAVENSYNLGRAVELQAQIWYRQRRFQEATSEALRAKKIYGQLGATNDVRSCKTLLQNITKATKRQAIKGRYDLDGSDSGSERS